MSDLPRLLDAMVPEPPREIAASTLLRTSRRRRRRRLLVGVVVACAVGTGSAFIAQRSLDGIAATQVGATTVTKASPAPPPSHVQVLPSATSYPTDPSTHGYPVNSRGETYGVNGPTVGHDGFGPQLVEVTGVGGVVGYFRASEMNEALRHDLASVTLYAVDGVTVVGSYRLGGPAAPPR